MSAHVVIKPQHTASPGVCSGWGGGNEKKFDLIFFFHNTLEPSLISMALGNHPRTASVEEFLGLKYIKNNQNKFSNHTVHGDLA